MKKFKRILSCIFVLVFLLSTFSGIAVTAASVVYNDGDTAGLPVKPDGVIHRTANRLAWSQSNGKILTGRKGALRVAQGQLMGLTVEASSQRYAYAGFVGGSENQRAVEMIDMYTSDSLGYWQYRNAKGEYANPRALTMDGKKQVIVGLDGTSEGVQVAFLLPDTETGEMTQTLIAQVLAQPEDGTQLLCRGLKCIEIGKIRYLYVLTSDGKDTTEAASESKANYDRVYRYIVTVNKDTRALTLDTAFGINEAGTKGGGYAVVKVASGLNTEGDSSVAELYGVDVRSDGAVFIGCGNNRTNAVVLSADGASGLGKLYDNNNDAWTPNGPIALVDDAYLGVMNNKYGGSQWAKGNMNVFNAQDLTQYTKQTYWEQLCWLEPYEKNVCYAMCYVGGNLYYTNVSNGNATDDYYSAGADQIIVMNIAAKSGKKYSAAMASRIFTNQAGRASDLKTIWAQSKSNILTTPGQTLKTATGQLEGFAVSPDEQFAFLGFSGGEAENRALEMISLGTGESLGSFRHQDAGGAYAVPRAADADGKNHVYVGWDSTSEGIQITRLDYTAEGVMTEGMTFNASNNTGLLVRDIRYRVLNGIEYLYVLMSDGLEGADNTRNDRIYRYTIGDNTLTVDKTFGIQGFANPRVLSGRSDNGLTELYAIDVDTDGTVYVTSNDGPMAARLTKNGTEYTALWGSNTDNSKSQGAIAVVDRFVITPINAGAGVKEGMAWDRNIVKDRDTGKSPYNGLWSFTKNSARIKYNAEVMNYYTHMRYVNGTLYIADRGAGEATEAVDVNADKIWKVTYDSPVYNDTVKTIGFQTSDVNTETNTYCTRFVATLDSLEYNGAGFEISYEYTNAEGVLVKHSYTPEETVCKNAYTGISGMGATLRAQGLGGRYLIAMSVENIPTSIGEITFSVRAYVLGADGTQIFESETPTTITIKSPAN